jgi:hypothetical protein
MADVKILLVKDENIKAKDIKSNKLVKSWR